MVISLTILSSTSVLFSDTTSSLFTEEVTNLVGLLIITSSELSLDNFLLPLKLETLKFPTISREFFNALFSIKPESCLDILASDWVDLAIGRALSAPLIFLSISNFVSLKIARDWTLGLLNTLRACNEDWVPDRE